MKRKKHECLYNVNRVNEVMEKETTSDLSLLNKQLFQNYESEQFIYIYTHTHKPMHLFISEQNPKKKYLPSQSMSVYIIQEEIADLDQ